MPRIDQMRPNATDGIADEEVTIVGGSVTATIPAGSVIAVTDNGGSLTVDDGATTLSVDDGGSTISIDDGAGSLTVDGTVEVTNTETLADDINEALAINMHTEGSESQVIVSDMRLQETLDEILKQLKIMNIHLSLMTDTYVRKQDIYD